MRQLASLLFASLILGGICFSDVAGRTWVASPEPSEGDGLLADILEGVAEADTVRLLRGVHQWPERVRVSLRIEGDEGAIVRGGPVGATEVSWFEFHNVQFENLLLLLVDTLERLTVTDCSFREGDFPFTVVRCDSIFVRGCEFVDNVPLSRPETGGLLIDVSIDHAEIVDCLFARNLTQAGDLDNPGGHGGGALKIANCKTAVVKGCVFRENRALTGSAMRFSGDSIVLENNTFYGNDCQSGAATIRTFGGVEQRGIIRHNIFANNTAYGIWISLATRTSLAIYCNAFWNNGGGRGICAREQDQWWTCTDVPYGYEGTGDFHSVIADPEFCDDGTLRLSKASPLAHPPGQPCEPIGGGKGFGCGVDPVLETSWGAVKRMFQERN